MESEKLIEELKKANLIDEATRKTLQKETALSDRTIEELIYERRIIDEDRLARLKSSLLKIPHQKVLVDTIDEKVLKTIPEETVVTYKVLPIQRQNNLLVVGMVHPDDPKAQEALKFIARREHVDLGIYLISFGDWQSALKRYSPYKSEVEEALKLLKLKGGGLETVELEEGGKGISEEAPIIRIVAQTLREAVQLGASDVHVEPLQNYVRIRFRVDGKLREALTLPLELASAIVSRVKVISNLKIDEARIPQDGRFHAKLLGRGIDFRVATYPTPLGEKVAIRVLDPATGLKKIDDLGLAKENAARVKVGLDRPFGLVLITGPTGSGKTTTIYAFLQSLNEESVNILSLEDPVEYFVPGINQSQVHPDIGYDFAGGLRQMVRQDPDIIFVGEIRDSETAALAIHASLTGHIVLSTLHTNNAVGAIPRLIDMGVEPFLLPSALNFMMSQRLISKLCDSCKKAETAPPAIQKLIKKALTSLPPAMSVSYKEPYQVYRAEGCSECQGKGRKGRIAIFELFEMTPQLEEIVNTPGGPSPQKVLGEARRQGMITLRQNGVFKALDGTVSIEEVFRQTEDV